MAAAAAEADAQPAPEATAAYAGAGGLSTGRKLVPWSSWEEWRFVRDGLFSAYPAAALCRIAAWRSRGSLPIPVDVTAAFVEIRLRDPLFQGGPAGDGALESEEMLAMLYSMAIMRLVNGFVENPHKKTGRSISELAEAVGIPRVLVDIRHESSHRNLPSLRLLRLASVKAFDWLKCIYWDRQTNAIPDAQVELRLRMHEIAHFLKANYSKESKSGSKRKREYQQLIERTVNEPALEFSLFCYNRGRLMLVLSTWSCAKLSVVMRRWPFSLNKSLANSCPEFLAVLKKGSDKLISKTIKYTRRLYYACPSEIVSVLLDLLQLDAPESSESSDIQQTDSLAANHSDDNQNIQISNSDMKTVMMKLSEKEPRLLLSVLKSVIEMIEAEDTLKIQGESYACLPVEPSKMKNLCSLVLWLVTNIKELKDSGYIGLVHEIGVLSSDKNAVPRFCLAKLLRKLLNLSTIGERCIIDATLLLIEMVNNNEVKDKLRKLPVLSQERLAKVCSFIRNEQESVEKATEMLEMFKLQLKRRNDACLAESGTEGLTNTSVPEKYNRWSIAKSWTPCPIGTIPCSFSSTAVLPAFDIVDHGLELATLEQRGTFEDDDNSERFDSHPGELEDEHILEISRSSPEHEISDMAELTCPLKGRLLVGGVWKKVTEEELIFIKSNMKILS
ncbi:hypothetical protein ACP70R_036579 [Stipagrostis hirtigluma subsp. patula]